MSDEQIARLIYSDSARTPAEFYAEQLPATTAWVSTVHLKNTDLAVSDAPAAASVHEVCTDDWNEALAWSEATARRLPTYGDLVETNANPRFFEFVRVPRSNQQAFARQRVFRCAYLDRSNVVRWTHAVDVGTGRVTRILETLLGFKARESSGAVSVCSA